MPTLETAFKLEASTVPRTPVLLIDASQVQFLCGIYRVSYNKDCLLFPTVQLNLCNYFRGLTQGDVGPCGLREIAMRQFPHDELNINIVIDLGLIN